MNDVAQSVKPSFNPLDTIRNEIQSAKDDLKGVTHSRTDDGASPAVPSTEATTPAAPPPAEIRIEPPPPAPVSLAGLEPPRPRHRSPSLMVEKPKRTRKSQNGRRRKRRMTTNIEDNRAPVRTTSTPPVRRGWIT